MKKTTLFFALLAVTFSVTAKIKTHVAEESDWAEKPVLHTFPKEYAGQPAIILTEKDKVSYKYEGKGTSIYHTFHRITKILDARGVENYSTVSIPFYTDAHIEEIKARTISAEGKVYDIPLHMFKQSQDDYGFPVIKFAMEGVGKNAEVEVFLKTITPFSMFGSEYFQREIPILDLDFEMAYPKDFIIEQKGFNGFENMQDTLILGRRHMKVEMHDIPAVKIEPQSYIYPHLMRTEWRISYWANDYGDEKRLFTWDDFAKNFYFNVFNIPDGTLPLQYFLNPKGQDYYRGDTERRAVNRFLETIGVTGSERELEKIKKIERGIKNNITLYPSVADHSGRLDTIISKHSATVFGYLKLFAACFAQTDVKCEIGVTTDRRWHLFNSTFENWDFLSDYIFYFPNQKNYLAPTNVFMRYPLIPGMAQGNAGAFCKMSTPAEARPRVADVRLIPENSPFDNNVTIAATVNFKNAMNPELDLKYAYTGLESVPVRTLFSADKEHDRQRDYVEGMVAGVIKHSDLQDFSVSNESLDSYATGKPVVLKAKVRSSGMVEKAGGRILFRMGEIMGHKENLYDPKERKLPIDIDHPHSQKTVITVDLGGYRVLNLKALRNRVIYYAADHRKVPTCSFISSYTQKGGKLIITVNEVYSKVHYHLREYPEYRKVLNAAADFSKLNLVLGR